MRFSVFHTECEDDILENLKYYLRVKKLHYFNIYAYTLKITEYVTQNGKISKCICILQERKSVEQMSM